MYFCSSKNCVIEHVNTGIPNTVVGVVDVNFDHCLEELTYVSVSKYDCPRVLIH
jgi:energy-converting hydrogenase Eha subunit E